LREKDFEEVMMGPEGKRMVPETGTGKPKFFRVRIESHDGDKVNVLPTSGGQVLVYRLTEIE
jgi:hypothetical protein